MHNFYFNFVVACLATYRITSIINRERIFAWLRKWIGETDKEIAPGVFATIQTTFLAELVSCFWCLSVWIGFICTLFLFFFPYVLYPFALSMVGIIVKEWHEQTQAH